MEVFDSSKIKGNQIDEKKVNAKRWVIGVIVTIIASFVSALALHVFVYPANFVPLGLEAVVTMIATATGKQYAGYINLALNAPLFIYAFIKLNKKYLILSLLFTVLSSVFLIILPLVNFPVYMDKVSGLNVNNGLLASIFTGVMLGVRTGLMFRIGASSGGVDIIAKMIERKKPHIPIERIITIFCLVLIGVSYFVYQDFNCILLGIVQMFVSEFTIRFLMKNTRNAIEVKIVTKHVEELREEIIANLRHGATLIQGTGMYSLQEYSIILTVLNLNQIAEVTNIVKKYPDTFMYFAETSGVMGNFRWREDEKSK